MMGDRRLHPLGIPMVAYNSLLLIFPSLQFGWWSFWWVLLDCAELQSLCQPANWCSRWCHQRPTPGFPFLWPSILHHFLIFWWSWVCHWHCHVVLVLGRFCGCHARWLVWSGGGHHVMVLLPSQWSHQCRHPKACVSLESYWLSNLGRAVESGMQNFLSACGGRGAGLSSSSWVRSHAISYAVQNRGWFTPSHLKAHWDDDFGGVIFVELWEYISKMPHIFQWHHQAPKLSLMSHFAK